ncbi:MAG: cereblon family protein [Syntrophaceae bacterium]
MTACTRNETHPVQTSYPWILKQSSEEQIETVSVKISQAAETEKEKESILCKTCKNEITTSEYTTAVNGQHAHIFQNPAGITFHIGCFSQTWGCFMYGIPTHEFTWFPGFSWRVVLCVQCFSHLGWYYQSGGGSFYGLILANLVKDYKIH